MTIKPERRRPGRPPAGRRGEKVREYPQLSVRVPPDIKRTLKVLALVKGTTQWQVITDCVVDAVRRLSEPDRKRVEALLNRHSGATRP